MDDESSIVMEPMVDFWGVELSGKCKTVKWPTSEQDLEPDVTVRLELRQACLGARAKAGERNVVELTAEDESGEEVTHSIVSLTVGGTEQSPLFLEVFPPVTFHLASGSGPLHVVGSVHTELEDFASDDEEEEDEISVQDVVKSRKRTAESPPTKLTKTRKIVKENGDTSMDCVGDDEEEEEEEEEEDESGEESESENDESNENESDEHKTPQKPSLVSKPKAKSVQKPPRSMATKALSKTPQPAKGSRTSGKTSFSAPNTPEQTKTTKKGTKFSMNVEDMKEKLKKTPNLPKKLDKFSNYVQQNFKVTDDKVKKQLWEFAQKIRATK